MGDTADFSSLNGLNGLNLGQVHDAIADAIGDREALVFRDRRFTHGEVAERSRRFANFLVALGITTHTERKDLENWQSGHDHVALYMYNGNEYLECLLGCVKARAAGANINFRYVAEELRYVLNDANAKAIVYHACFAPVVAAVLPQIGPQKALIQVADSSGQPLLPGALDYEDVLAAASSRPSRTSPLKTRATNRSNAPSTRPGCPSPPYHPGSAPVHPADRSQLLRGITGSHGGMNAPPAA